MGLYKLNYKSTIDCVEEDEDQVGFEAGIEDCEDSDENVIAMYTRMTNLKLLYCHHMQLYIYCVLTKFIIEINTD